MTRALCAFIRLYQKTISPIMPGTCRFEPTCSQYAIEAIELHGAWRGTTMAARRLGRCRPGPGGGSGYDPVS